MALVVEDGTGKTDAESYATVVEADAYATLVDNTAWAALSTANKERGLRLGTRFLEEKFGTRFIGYRANDTQALCWPRDDVEDRDGYEVDDDELPLDLKNACIEAAFRASLADITPDIDTDDSSGLVRKKIKIGPIEIEKEFGGPLALEDMFLTIERLLMRRGLILGGSRAVRG